jgi:hypothetical protein
MKVSFIIMYSYQLTLCYSRSVAYQSRARASNIDIASFCREVFIEVFPPNVRNEHLAKVNCYKLLLCLIIVCAFCF